MTDGDYAGDINPSEAWRMLSEDPQAVLIDVRTEAEWRYVGMPDLSGLDKKTHCVSWQLFPVNRTNENFAEEVRAIGVTPDQPLLMICRSGVRSRSAAIAMAKLGFTRSYNVADGFEGPPDDDRHRGQQAGWKVSGLPWAQS